MFPQTVNVCSELSVLTSRMRTGVPTGTFSRPPPSSPFSVGIPSNVCAANAMSRPGCLSRGSITITPNRPRRTSCEETWWVWYQNVPTWSARKR